MALATVLLVLYSALRLLCSLASAPLDLAWTLHRSSAPPPVVAFAPAVVAANGSWPPYTLVAYPGTRVVSYNTTPLTVTTSFGGVVYNKTCNETWFAPPRNLASALRHKVPIPTNRWWGNWIAYSENHTDVCAWASPYAVCLFPRSIGVWYPPARRVFGNFSGIGDSPEYYYHEIASDVVLSAKEVNKTDATPFQVVGWDDLGVTVRASRHNKSVQATVVSGMAYFTATFAGLSPLVRANHTIVRVNGRNASRGALFSNATKLTLDFNNSQTWVVYASPPVTWKLTSATDLRAAAYEGHIRVALAPNGSSGAEYDVHADCIVTGGRVELAPTTYSFAWNTTGACAAGLLHFGLRHHVDTLDQATATEVTAPRLESSTRGALYPLVSLKARWTLKEPTLLPATFLPRVSAPHSRLVAANLTGNLKADILSNWTMESNGSYYFNGKAAQKYASLCLMASDTNVVGRATSYLKTCQRKLEKALTPFIDNSWTYPLVYDGLYRGIVSSQGFAENETYADFGNTMYNDHHYHYGYWVTAAAIANYVHPSWARLPALNARIETLVRDVANANASDPLFPTFRAFDWYKGHSYSHGATAMTDGKDQESSSEDINFHYGLSLFGGVTQRAEIETLGRLMLTLNARAAQTYFLMEDASTVQHPRMRPNKVLGIIFDNKVDYTTWFSNETHCIHGIQMLPTTPVTEFVRTKTFVSEEWTQVLSKLPIVTNVTLARNNTWASILYLNYARVDPDAALKMLAQVPMDDGLSRSWALYMAASQDH
ncbi:endo-1,3(4)-beta-glucanase [Achlya hypogyna]|uniref:glucan endo-1,3-beta-D-glucosidase n=1 Tax=Achlya hypogyna TaxID=1202772 RepID=A0A0A7CPN8_ACHHY|nr:secreted protein [Achlya hypogyna]OQR80551.1 endo-1,3(4)-beta-glucanase [Achlya hypogyna]